MSFIFRNRSSRSSYRKFISKTSDSKVLRRKSRQKKVKRLSSRLKSKQKPTKSTETSKINIRRRSYRNNNTSSSMYKLQNLIIRIEPMPHAWVLMMLNGNSEKNRLLKTTVDSTNQQRGRKHFETLRTDEKSSTKSSGRLCRSPVLTRRPKRKFSKFMETPRDISPVSLQKSVVMPSETLITQEKFCTFYPSNIKRCVDCQMGSSKSCRFQHCRKLKFFGDNRFEFSEFSNVTEAKMLSKPNSGGQPAFTLVDAQYVLLRIGKLFSSMFLHEENERSKKNEKNIIWKRCVAGWREVCDQCLTTLFNCHYMCRECGSMICIECWNGQKANRLEKRKRSKLICSHPKSFSLAEFLPWQILSNLRQNCVNYLSKLEINRSSRFCPKIQDENLSEFLRNLKTRRAYDARRVQLFWSSADCNDDSNIEFYCGGRLPVFNEWTSTNAKRFFQKVWTASCPVLVKNIHLNLSKRLWSPESFKEHMIDHRETPALWDCETLTPVLTNSSILTKFWDGFERLDVRLKDEENGGRARILKLKDWPTKKDFASVFPTRLHDLMENIPFGDYTRRSYVHNDIEHYGGVFNIVERLPIGLVKPDLGPKLYIAYSQLTSQASKKAGTTNLHIDVSDAVNVLVYVGIGGHGTDGQDKTDEIQQVEDEILQSNLDESQLQRLRNGERPGALWHLFRSDDVKKIREYIGKTRRKSVGSDSIHDQRTYLENDDLIKLKELNQVESYPILQFLGDAVFIPSGAPHQVKNLHSCIKIAEDFVSPENLDRCLITTNEFRTLSKMHTNHADILQAKNILFYTIRDAFHTLNQTI